ncbi:MAG: hypothetical protein M1823_000880 [Watsoniomyces obsoletus]|nr:MAG: hypothetical protein M1823_000880 [Watsoniomyces obsoletus]
MRVPLSILVVVLLPLVTAAPKRLAPRATEFLNQFPWISEPEVWASKRVWVEAATYCLKESCAADARKEFNSVPGIPQEYEDAFTRGLTEEYISCVERASGRLTGPSPNPRVKVLPPEADEREICRKRFLVSAPELNEAGELVVDEDGELIEKHYAPDQGAFFKKVAAAPGSGTNGIQQVQSRALETWNHLKAVRMPSGELSMSKINLGDVVRGAASNAFQQAARSRALMPIRGG